MTSQTLIREVVGVKSIESLIKHLDKVKDLFENDVIEILFESIDRDTAKIHLRRIRNNE